MGSTTSKQAPEHREQSRPCLDSLLPKQNERINSNASDRVGRTKWEYLSEEFDSKEDDSNKHSSDHGELPFSPQMPIRFSCGPEPQVFDTSGQIHELENTWQLFDTSDLMYSYLNLEISSSSEITSDDNPQPNNETKNRKSHLLSKCPETPQLLGIVSARVNSFERKLAERRMKRVSLASTNPSVKKKKVVFYFTSLTAIPSTHEDCQDAKRILEGYGVRLDKRDVSMDAQFKYELKELLGMSFQGKLPWVFVDGCCIGGAKEVKKLHSNGELGYYLQGCEMKADAKDGNFKPCPGCADERFLLCWSCSGSRRVYLETSPLCKDKIALFQRCNDCNDCGLIRCPVCW